MMKVCVFVFDCYDIPIFLFFGNRIIMLLLFHHWNNTKEENKDTVTDEIEGMSTPHQKSNE